jgi:hypothetical protein
MIDLVEPGAEGAAADCPSGRLVEQDGQAGTDMMTERRKKTRHPARNG